MTTIVAYYNARHLNSRVPEFGRRFWGERPLLRIILATLCLGSAHPVLGDEPKPESSDVLATLSAIWESQLQEVITAEIHFRRFNHSGGFKPLSPPEVRETFRSFDLVDDDWALRDLVNALLQEPHPAERPWSEYTFQLEGQRTREETDSRVHVFDGTDEIITNPANNMVYLGQRPGPPRHRNELPDFWYIVPRALHPHIQISSVQAGNMLTLFVGETSSNCHTEFVVDPNSGAVHEHIRRVPGGAVRRQTLQTNWLEVSPGIEFPFVHAEFDYAADTAVLRGAKIVVVSNAQFNQPLADGTFAVAADGGTRIRDFRDGRDRDGFAVANLADVKQYASLEPVAPAGARGPPYSDRGFGAWLILGNVVALLMFVGGYLLWGRKTGPKNRDPLKD